MSGIREVGWWRWPLWSWRNLAVTVLGAAVLVAGLGRVSGGAGGGGTRGESAPGGGHGIRCSLTFPSAIGRVRITNAERHPGDSESPEDVAVAFVGMWARPDAEVEEWRASCKAVSTPRFAAILDAASSAAVPASRVVGDTEILERSDASARVRVPTDGGAVHVALERTPAGWRVDGIEPEELNAALASRS